MAQAFRAVALYAGRVQGVGFRFTAVNVAARFAVKGYVRNLPSGKVEVVAEGTRDEVPAFLTALRKAMSRNIDTVDITWATATAEFEAFSVRF